jgi:DNA-nicking Smr family endonuclease
LAGGKKTKDFSTSPFRSLKGLCVDVRNNKPETLPPAVAPKPAPAADESLFAEEMVRLGIKGAQETTVPPAKTEVPDAASSASAPLADRDLFLAAIGKLETTFVDELPAPLEPPATPRLKKLVRSGKFVPDAELDLHGLDRMRARERVRNFLENAVYQGKKSALLITGRGHGSTGEPVLRTEVENYLAREAGTWVSEWAKAPRQYGGDGAFVLLLRAKKKE